MISFKFGDILDSRADVIAYQVNCQGVMKTGLALRLKENYPALFPAYRDFCDREFQKEKLLGKVQMCWCKNRDEKNKYYLANLFTQLNDGEQTNYIALELALARLEKEASKKFFTIAIPYGIGCDSTNNNWGTVSNIIFTVFGKSAANVEIWRKNPPKPIKL